MFQLKRIRLLILLFTLLFVFRLDAQIADSTYHKKVDSVLVILQQNILPFITSMKEDQQKREKELKLACEKEQAAIKKQLADHEAGLKQSKDSLLRLRNDLNKQLAISDSLKKNQQNRKVRFETFLSALDQQDHHIQSALLDMMTAEGNELKKGGISDQQIERITDFKRKCEALRFTDDLINKNLTAIDQINEARNKLNETFSKGQNFSLLSQENKKFQLLLSNYESRICELKDVIHIILDLSVMSLEEKQENFLKVISILDFKDYGFLNSLIQKFYLNPNNSVLPNYKLKCS